ncbi:MAG: hypothetical protein GVY23_02360 [Spirochaetes bacterium]|jgi:hypothetical protein|nr:hypothetical protein [Spirochaetota bacterium]
MKDDADRALLIAELEGDLQALSDLLESNNKSMKRIGAGATEELDYAALGYTLHNLYNLMENSFLRITKHFENDIGSEGWHKELLHRMTLSIEGIRPPVIDRPTAEQIDELRAFRHVFRNMYRKNLDPEKLLLLQKRLPDMVSSWKTAIANFIDLLKSL